jgi:hypothetical protein
MWKAAAFALSCAASVAVAAGGCAATSWNVPRPQVPVTAGPDERKTAYDSARIHSVDGDDYIGGFEVDRGRLKYAVGIDPEASTLYRSYENRMTAFWILLGPTAATGVLAGVCAKLAAKGMCPPDPPGTIAFRTDCWNEQSERNKAIGAAVGLGIGFAALLGIDIWLGVSARSRRAESIDTYNRNLWRGLQLTGAGVAPVPGGAVGSLSLGF